METIIIAAVARNRVIGDKGRIPWHIREDFAHFKRTTTGHAVIMGRKTFESIGKPLPGRVNIVLTRNENYTAPEGVILKRSLEEAIAYCAETRQEKAFIIGGAKAYEEGMGMADTLIITEINQDPEGDTFFPAIDKET